METEMYASSFHMIMPNICICFSFDNFFVGTWLDKTILFTNEHSLGRAHLRILFRHNWLQTYNFTCPFHFLTCFISNYPDQLKISFPIGLDVIEM